MKKYLKYVKPHALSFVLGPLCMIIEVIGDVVMPYFLSVLINSGMNGTLTVGKSIGLAALMILTAVIMMASGVGGSYFGSKASVNFAADLRSDIFSKVQKFSFANIDKFSTGSLVTRLTNDVTQIQNMVNMLLRMFLRSPGMLIGALIMAITIRPSLSVVFAVVIPLMAISVFFIIRTGFSRFAKVQERIDQLNSTVQENITNVRVVKSFVREDFEKEKFKTANKSLKNTAMSAMRVMIFMSPVMTIFMNLATVAVLWFGGQIVLGEANMIGGMQIGDLSAFLTYVSQILMSLMMITHMLMMSSRALASAKRISEVLDEKSDINDDSAAFKDKVIEKGEIQFKNVGFRYYKNSEDEVLENINLKIEAGSTVGIIGSTGSGKTSLVSLIPRLYDADQGQVLIDGIDVKDYSIFNLREGVGMVLQKNVLFSGSIEENLRWGLEDATKAEIEKAASYAQAHSFVSGFTEGYDTELGQGGVNISGGQKQRLCIARALLKKPKILILDDSTSAVDTATEKEIRSAFKNELKGSTKIIIAQRISSVIESDTIVVMNDGKITGVGKHEDLLESCEEYKEIYYSQTDKKEE